jgi:fumarate hydratase class II
MKKNNIVKKTKSVVNKYWGLHTKKSLINFNIGNEIVSLDLIRAVAAIK